MSDDKDKAQAEVVSRDSADDCNDNALSGSESSMDFSTVMASAIHDMKNSLGLLMNTLHGFYENLPQGAQDDKTKAVLQYEAERVNNYLIQLLGLYRLDQNQLRASIDECLVYDFLEEQRARYSALAGYRNIEISIQCESDLQGYFDTVLVGGVINNLLTNALRYTNDKILMTAVPWKEGVRIEIQDNGEGYPEGMIAHPGEINKQVDFKTGSTSLGLYFSKKVAALHSQNGQQGWIELANGGSLGGGLFALMLP